MCVCVCVCVCVSQCVCHSVCMCITVCVFVCADLPLCEFYMCTADLYSALNDSVVCARVACPWLCAYGTGQYENSRGDSRLHCDVHFESEYNWRLAVKLSHPGSLFCKGSHLIYCAVLVFV